MTDTAIKFHEELNELISNYIENADEVLTSMIIYTGKVISVVGNDVSDEGYNKLIKTATSEIEKIANEMIIPSKRINKAIQTIKSKMDVSSLSDEQMNCLVELAMKLDLK